MKRIINPKTIKKNLEKRQLAQAEAMAKATFLSEEEKNNIQATVLRELTVVCSERIKLLESVLGRKVSITTRVDMPGDETREFQIIVKEKESITTQESN